jgi:predicted amidohydrolase YtcJ
VSLWRFENLLPQARKLGVIVSQQGLHIDTGGIEPETVNMTRAEPGQPLRFVIAAGIPLAMGLDWPPSPYLRMMFASTRPSRPAEASTREQALSAYTTASAYAEFAENEKVTLFPGTLADVAVLSQEIFTVPAAELPTTTSLLTIVGGQIVYDAGQLSSVNHQSPGPRLAPLTGDELILGDGI